MMFLSLDAARIVTLGAVVGGKKSKHHPCEYFAIRRGLQAV
jgi:hypothetical protein